MPSVSDKQHNAMEAAAHGKSTLGIPSSVGKKFVAADAGKKGMAAGGLVPAGKRLVDHGDHFKIHSKDGKVHTMAKKGLHPSTVKHLQKFAEGGQVEHYAEGGRKGEGVLADEGGHDADTQRELEASDEGARGEGQFGAPQPAASKEAEDAQYSEDQYNQSMKPDMPGQEVKVGDPSPVEGSALDSADTSNKLPEAPPEAPAVTSENVQLGKFGSAKVHGISDEERQGVADAAAARTENAKTQEELAKQTEAINTKKAETLTKLQTDSDAKMHEISTRADQLRQDIENGKIDPNHYWHEKGTGGRIMASIGLLLSGLGSGMGGGPNMAMQVIQSNIKRDIDAQEKNLETKKSMLADTYRQTGDLRLARQMAEHTATNVALAQLNTVAAKSSSAQVKAIAQVANAQGQQLLAQQARGIADRQSANDMGAHNANVAAENARKLQVAKAGDGLKTPREMQGAKIASMNSSLVKLQDHLKNLDKGWQGPVAGRIAESFPWGGADTKANAAAADLLRESIASSFGGGVASDARIQAAKASVPGPTDPPAVAQEKIRRLERDLVIMRNEYIAQQGGVGNRVGPQNPVTPPEAPTRKR